MFHDLGRVRELKAARPDLIIGVGGCVASQEGAAIVRRAPYVDVVFGPQTLHRLPAADRARAARPAVPQVDICFPEIEKFDHLPPPRVDGASAFVSIMEGCSKYCTFCVVPYTRGEEVSRPFDDVLTEVADLADQGVREVTLLGQNVNAYRGRDGRRRRASPTSRRCSSTSPRSRASSASATRRRIRGRCRRGSIAAYARLPQAGLAPAPAGAVGLRPRARGDEARLHGARVQVDRPARCARRARRSRSPPTSSSAFPARPRPISTQTMQLVEDVDFDGASASSTARAPARRPPSSPTRCRPRSSRRDSSGCRPCSTRSTARYSDAMVGTPPARAGHRAARSRMRAELRRAPRTTAS